MKREGWYLVVGKWNGAPVRVHLVAPVLALIMPGHPPTPGTVVGLGAVVLVHELGHALLVRQLGGVVQRIDVLPWGGECGYSGIRSELHESMVAWGGVLAQFVVMVLAQLFLWSGAPLRTPFAEDFFWAISLANLMIAAVNLLPIPPLDGAKAWRLVVLGPALLLGGSADGATPSLSTRFKRWRGRRKLRVVAPAPTRKAPDLPN
jgi:hypothetical protein